VTTARTVSFATLGCRLNQVDTQQLQTLLEARGFRTVGLDEPADVVVVNTCTVTARAEFSDRQAIRRAARTNPRAKLVVTGCWAQTSPGDVAGMSEVDLVVGNDDKRRLPDLLDRVVGGKVHVSDIAHVSTLEAMPPGLELNLIFPLPLGRMVSTRARVLRQYGDQVAMAFAHPPAQSTRAIDEYVESRLALL